MSESYDDEAYAIDAHDECAYLIDINADCGDFWFERKEFVLCIGRVVRICVRI